MPGASMMSRSWNIGGEKTESMTHSKDGRVVASRGSAASHCTESAAVPGELAACHGVGGQRQGVGELEGVYAHGGAKQHRVGYGEAGSTPSLRHDSTPVAEPAKYEAE